MQIVLIHFCEVKIRYLPACEALRNRGIFPVVVGIPDRLIKAHVFPCRRSHLTCIAPIHIIVLHRLYKTAAKEIIIVIHIAGIGVRIVLRGTGGMIRSLRLQRAVDLHQPVYLCRRDFTSEILIKVPIQLLHLCGFFSAHAAGKQGVFRVDTVDLYNADKGEHEQGDENGRLYKMLSVFKTDQSYHCSPSPK